MAPRSKRHEVTQPLHESYRYIALTQGQTATVDLGDFEFLSQFSWHAQCGRNQSFYEISWADGKILYMHRLVLGLGKMGKTTVVDHIDRDSLNNRKSNLRICTQSDNRANCKRWDRKTGDFKGVYLIPSQWRVRICKDGKRISLGTFDSPEEAARAYDKKAKELFGEFAHLNFPAHQ